jgi:hypothetical protein
MSVFIWKKSYTKKENTLIINVLLKEFVSVNYDISNIKKPCWLVFRHLETNDFCCVGHVESKFKTIADTIPKEATRTLVRSYKDWDEIVNRYINGEELSTIEKKCANKILSSPVDKDDKEWRHLQKYWNNLKEIS